MNREDVEKVVESLRDMGILRTLKISGDWYSCYCPFHADGNEKKPSFGILLADQYRNGRKYSAGFAHCFTCGYAKNLLEFVKDIFVAKDISESATSWLSNILPEFSEEDDSDLLLPLTTIQGLNATYAVDYMNSLIKPKQEFVSEQELASYRYTVPYMYQRGLTDAIIDKYDIGYDAHHIPPGRKAELPCITFPVRDKDGNTLFFCRRSIEGKYFNYPRNVQKPVYGIYELPKDCKSVVVCESCFNALTCIKYGKPAVALLGTSNSYQIQQLKELGVSEFILAFDPDEAGRRATAKLKKALKEVAIVWSYVGIPEGKDINDLDYETFINLELE